MQQIVFAFEIITIILPIAIVIYLLYVIIGETKVKCKQCGIPAKRKNRIKGKCAYCETKNIKL